MGDCGGQKSWSSDHGDREQTSGEDRGCSETVETGHVFLSTGGILGNGAGLRTLVVPTVREVPGIPGQGHREGVKDDPPAVLPNPTDVAG